MSFLGFPRQSRSRGQALVETALVLPILALLLVMAIDFGRVFFGWVALQNAARIAADTASQRADAWPSADGDEEQDWRADYQAFITHDLQGANCSFPTPHPDPVFTDVNGGGDHDFGDLATVHLECQFGLITPLAENILGGPVTLAAESTFAINGLVVVGVPDAPVAPPRLCQDPVASFTTAPAPSGGGRVNGSSSPFPVTFTSTTLDDADCPITQYVWEVDGTRVGTNSPVLEDHPFTDAPGGGPTNYTVRLTVTSDEGTDSTTIVVRVSA